MQIVLANITFVIIFTTIYSYGISILNIVHRKGINDIFFKLLIGYIFIGTLTVIYHFFFEINDFFSLLIVIFGFVLFVINFNSINKKEYLKLILLILIFSFILFAYSNHPIDTNMYHHPYVSYLKSEKIIFAIANIQFRFGHISFLQYVQAALTNSFFHKVSLASINIIFYICFVYFLLKKINKTKEVNMILLIQVLFLSFILIKFSRFREYGNDLIPLLVSIYFLTQILDSKYCNNLFNQKKLICMALPFAAFMFLHKISYVFVFFIFLPLISRKNLTIEKKIIFKYVIFLFFFTIPWLIKNYIVTSCFAYPVKLTCFSNSIYELKGLANPVNASWLTEIWAKGFVDHPNWQNINLKEYASGYNWVPTWMTGHFLKILEIISPLFFIIFLFVAYFYFKKKQFLVLREKRKFLTLLYQLWIANLFGLLIWFSNAPVFRYGSFYVISFVILSYVLLFDYFYILKRSKNLKFFKVIIFISLSFFILKNSLRINESSTSFFPKTSKNETEFTTHDKNGLKMLKPKKDLCYFTNSICSHEIPKNINVIKFGNYDILN